MKDSKRPAVKRWCGAAMIALVATFALGLSMTACDVPADTPADLTAEQAQPSAEAQAQQLASQPTGRPGRRPGGQLAKGQEAPVFDLPMLVYEQDENGELKPGLSEETIGLSSFRGQQVVCIFLSSYT